VELLLADRHLTPLNRSMFERQPPR